MQNVKCKILLVFMFCLFLQTMPYSAFAHKVNVFAYVEGNMVYTESYFPNGRKVNAGLIEVYNTKGEKLLDGRTDKEGQFNFKVSKREDLKIILTASLGHRATYTVMASEIAAIAKKGKPKGISLKDIIAGIGYILGITGIAMYFLAKKKINPALSDRTNTL